MTDVSARPPRWVVLGGRLLGHILDEDGDLLARWRARLTAAFLLAAATLGLVPAVSTIVVGIRDGLWPLVVLDALLVLVVYGLLLSRRPSNTVRNLFLVAASFSVGVTALVTLGPYSTALAWLLVSVFLVTFLLGPRASVRLGALIVLVLAAVTGGIVTGAFPWAAIHPDPLSRWLLTAFDFFFIMVIFAGANGLIIRILEHEDRARAAAEARLAEARRNEALGTLAGGIAHDFNNLLVPVLANVESVHDALTPSAHAPLREALREAHRSAERARDLVQRILAFGRGVATTRQLVDAVGVAREVLALARHAAPAGVRLVLDEAPIPPVLASESELHQVLHNLVTNAVLAIVPPGTVVVSVRPESTGGRGFVRLTVRDSGVGMDAATRERIFDPYFSTRAPGRGTGLGLPIVRSIVRSLDGELSVSSTPGEGSVFTVRLPVPPSSVAPSPATLPTTISAAATPAVAAHRRPTPTASSPAPHAMSARRGMGDDGLDVLLVDDEDSVRRATARLLESLGCRVTMADGVDEAVAHNHAPETAFDVVITDHRMPGRPGTALIRELHRRRDGRPIVLMSGHLDDATGDADSLDGVVLLAKPFARQELAAALEAATGRPWCRQAWRRWCGGRRRTMRGPERPGRDRALPAPQLLRERSTHWRSAEPSSA